MNKGFLSTFLALFVCFICFTSVSGQQSQPDEFNSDTSKDDILILVNITAKELKFDAVPNTSVEFPGTRHRTTIWLTQRQNLPEKVEPGVTYRDIGMQLRISSRFADIERIVQEALGEVPITDDDPKTTPPASSAEPARAPSQDTESKSKPAPVSRRLPRHRNR